MELKALFTTISGNIAYKILWSVLILGIICGIVSCSYNTVVAGKDGIRIRAGEWIGGSADNAFSMQLKTGDGGNIFLFSYSYPCGEEYSYVLPPKPIKIELNNSGFETTVDYTDLSPKFIITGKFIDSTHAEGTWETFDYQNIYLDKVCPAASGTWKGSPN